MLQAIRHRGPDDESFYFDETISLGHCRLTIVDKSGGHQPFYNEDKSVVVVSNSEIYNYGSLRERLANKGHSFRSECDTEVLVHLYEEYGIYFPEYLEGFYAIALYDLSKKTLIFSRDNQGIKPLFYTVCNNNLIFASEYKAIIRSGYLMPRMNEQALKSIHVFGYLLKNQTLVQDIYQFQSGHSYLWKEGKLYYKKNRSNTERGRYSKDAKGLLHILKESVAERLPEKVPFGTLLSGGIDSAIITALAHSVTSAHQELNVFTINDEDDNADISYARLIAKQFGCRHHEFTFGMNDILSEFPAIVFHQENMAYGIYNHFLCKHASKHAKVVLSGCGADELFGGYERYAEVASFRRQYLQKVNTINWDDPGILKSLEKLRTPTDFINFEITGGQLTNCQLLNVNRTSMASSLEARVTYLRRDMLSFANNLDEKSKVKESKNKIILRETGKKIGLPTTVVNRPKLPAGMSNTSPYTMPRFQQYCNEISCRIPRGRHDKYFNWPMQKVSFSLFENVFIKNHAEKPDYGLNDFF